MGEGGLKRWFEEKWVDVKTGKPCGRQKGENRAYPACRPSKRVSDKTPKTVGEMTKSEKDKFKREKKSSKKISYQHKRKKSPIKTKGKVFNPYSGRYVNKDGVTAKKYNLTMSPIPDDVVNKKLYQAAKNKANKKFKTKTGAYKSAYIVREYEKKGGTYKN